MNQINELIQKLKEVEKNHPMSGVKVAIYIAEDMIQQHKERTVEGKTPVEQLFKKLWDTPKDKWTWYAILEEAKEMEKEQIGYTKADVIKAGEMGEINYLDTLHITTYLDEAKKFNETYGGNK